MAFEGGAIHSSRPVFSPEITRHHEQLDPRAFHRNIFPKFPVRSCPAYPRPTATDQLSRDNYRKCPVRLCRRQREAAPGWLWVLLLPSRCSSTIRSTRRSLTRHGSISGPRRLNRPARCHPTHCSGVSQVRPPRITAEQHLRDWKAGPNRVDRIIREDNLYA